MSIIQTVSGRHLDLLSPSAIHIDIDDIAHSLSQICRFNGHTREFYSVAQHSVHVASLVPEAYALEALLHDAAEAYIGDLTSPLKSILPEYREVERRVSGAIREHFFLPDELSVHVHTADMIALATERRDLLAPTDYKWACLSGIEPSPATIRPLPPSEAERLFLRAYDHYSNIRDSLHAKL